MAGDRNDLFNEAIIEFIEALGADADGSVAITEWDRSTAE
jgi:hypothetical protein